MPLPRRKILTAPIFALMLAPALMAVAGPVAHAAVTKPVPDFANGFLGVSCPRPAMCMAVGNTEAASTERTLAERWNGTAWRRVPTPSAIGKHLSSVLEAVSCTSASQCVAVGGAVNTSTGKGKSIIERWNGKRWRLLRVSLAGARGLSGVSCTGRSCMIVGSGNGSTSPERPVAGQLVGNRLTAHAPRMPSRAQSATLVSVDCVASSACMAVGTTNWGAVAEEWNGSAWRVTLNMHSSATETVLDSVSCSSSRRCMAVGAPVAGNAKPKALTLLWREGRWHSLAIKGHQPYGYDVPRAVSCRTNSRCVVTEYSLNGDRSAGLIWSGGASLRVSKVSAPAIGSMLAISCPGRARCVAVGGYAANSHATFDGAFSDLWNGRGWKVLPVTG